MVWAMPLLGVVTAIGVAVLPHLVVWAARGHERSPAATQATGGIPEGDIHHWQLNETRSAP